jgi:hypothetical protein
MADIDEDRGRSRRLGAEDRGGSSTCRLLGGQTIQRSGDAVCGLHHAQVDEEHGFLSLASKPSSTVSPGLASKPMVMVCQRFGLKTTVTVSWLGLRTKVDDLVIWASKSPRRFFGLGLKAKWEEVFQFAPQNL